MADGGGGTAIRRVGTLRYGRAIRRWQLGCLGSPSDLAGQVSVTSNDTGGVLQIGADEPTGAEAVKFAHVLGGQLISHLDDQVKRSDARQRTQVDSQLRALSSQIAKLQQQGSSAVVRVR